MGRFLRRAAIVAVAALWAAAPAVAAVAQDVAPTIVLDRSSARVGDRIIVTLRDWRSPNVTVSTCGNLARRGSIDCNLVGSQGLRTNRWAADTVTELVIATPPVTCPCVIRVANPTQDEVVHAALTIEGHPAGPVMEPASSTTVAVATSARRVKGGIGGMLRSALGGPTVYELSVEVVNRSSAALEGLDLSGWVGRSAEDQARTIRLPTVARIDAGETWRHRQRVSLAAPVVGRFHWRVRVSGAGPVASAGTTTAHVPVLLLAAVAVVLADVILIAARRQRRRRPWRRAVTTTAGKRHGPALPLLAPVLAPAGPTEVTAAERILARPVAPTVRGA